MFVTRPADETSIIQMTNKYEKLLKLYSKNKLVNESVNMLSVVIFKHCLRL